MVPDELRKILVPYVKAAANNTLEEYSSMMDALPDDHLLMNNWPDYKTDCSAVFRIAHDDTAVILKFYIKKDFFQSAERPVNSDVHKDNCVEFFVRFGADHSYYNIEYSCLGIGKVGYGSSRTDRALLSHLEVGQIGVWTKFSSVTPVFDWEILLYIPTRVFRFKEIGFLSGQHCSANFYKCGDELPAPHFLTWSPVASAAPDFHRPESFGEIVFGDA
jgi:hypothetical protein